MEIIMHEHHEYLSLSPLSQGCGKPAFYSLRILDNGRPSAHVDDILTLDMKHPEIGKPMVCGSCGQPWSMIRAYSIKVYR